MIKKNIARLATKIKGRPVKFDPAITSGYLLQITFLHALALFRGIIRLRRLVSLGSDVSLRGKAVLDLASGVTVGDFCVLDAMGKEGLIIGERTSIGRFGIIKVSGTFSQIGKGIVIGKDVGIGEFCHIGGAGGVTIGDDTIVGSYFSIHPENHLFGEKDQLIRHQGVSHQGIAIGRNCWIGAKVTVLDGASVGNGCVIAAGAVVKGQFPDGCVIGGVPARILKKI
ncbi:acyltransferase [Pectobacterium versatile]|uniref:acyltransferase n=1 Tax=Pectobacterium versatile TaxID=2488639 RepID=UPI001F40C035|nr:acyltransferase [Pectobacterium versatile]